MVVKGFAKTPRPVLVQVDREQAMLGVSWVREWLTTRILTSMAIGLPRTWHARQIQENHVFLVLQGVGQQVRLGVLNGNRANKTSNL